MTTAHRPTYHPAVGSAHSGGFRFHGPRLLVHARDVHTHAELKQRRPGQATQAELSQRDLRRELRDRETAHRDREERLKDGRDEQPAPPSPQPQQQQRQLALPGPDTAQGASGAEGADAADEDRPPPAPLLDLHSVELSRFDDADAALSDPEEDDGSAHRTAQRSAAQRSAATARSLGLEPPAAHRTAPLTLACHPLLPPSLFPPSVRSVPTMTALMTATTTTTRRSCRGS